MHIESKLTFELRDEIGAGEGANSKVHTAFDHQLKATLVAKSVPIASFTDPAGFFDEATMLYESRHPNVVEVKYACQDDGNVYLVMPLYEGGSVEALLRKRCLTIREVVKLGLDFLGGLHHIHTKKLVHFDVKPTNVLIDSSGRAAVADFGLSKYLDRHGMANQDMSYGWHRSPESFKADRRGA